MAIEYVLIVTSVVQPAGIAVAMTSDMIRYQGATNNESRCNQNALRLHGGSEVKRVAGRLVSIYENTDGSTVTLSTICIEG